MKKLILFITILSLSFFAQADQDDPQNLRAKKTDSYLLKLTPKAKAMFLTRIQSESTNVIDLNFADWVSLEISNEHSYLFSISQLQQIDGVIHAQSNHTLSIFKNPTILRALIECPPGLPPVLCEIIGGDGDNGGGDRTRPNPNPPPKTPTAGDNPDIPALISNPAGSDPLISKQWGINDIGGLGFVADLPKKEIIVAIIDTGVDYTHEDLVENLWRNPGETGTDANGKDRTTNGVDDDNNGYIDDVIGWDFSSNDNKPYDLKAKSIFSGNPGHGTHVAGVVAARGNNGIGISGVAPRAKIMALRFISQNGQGTTAGAIGAIKYAVDNGAHISNNSWGGENGGGKEDKEENLALKEIIQYAQDKGSLFVVAAGNGRQGVGFNNDTDSSPIYPSSYDNDIIVSVAAIGSNNKLGSFSNWGPNSVDIAAPGVKVYSTIVGNGYTDVASAILGATWDGTSMASPHVAGAAALYWGKYPEKTWQEVKAAILNSAEVIPATQGKLSSNGKLSLKKLIP